MWQMGLTEWAAWLDCKISIVLVIVGVIEFVVAAVVVVVVAGYVVVVVVAVIVVAGSIEMGLREFGEQIQEPWGQIR